MMNDHYYKIYGWMKNVYKLRGNSLEVYAALYSLTRKKTWTGTFATLAGYLDIEIHLLRRVAKTLEGKGLLSIESIGYNTYAIQAVHPQGVDNYELRIKNYEHAEEQNVPAEEQNVPTEEQNVPTEEQNVPTEEQNVPNSKERSKENINNVSSK